MATRYVPFDGARVSKRWHVVLTAARADGVDFHVNSGHRTMREQAALFAQNMIAPGIRKPGRPMTAVPSPFAPHIRVGRAAHALDVNSLGGGEAELERWIERQGADWRNTVAGEPWHGEVSGADLKRLAKKFAGPRTLKFGMRGEDVQRLQVLLRGTGFLDVKKAGLTFGIRVRRGLKRFQRSKGLKADGAYGPVTRKALERAHDRR
jgi:hypothetical protein